MALAEDPVRLDPRSQGKSFHPYLDHHSVDPPASMAAAFHPDEEYVALESAVKSTSLPKNWPLNFPVRLV